MKNSMPVFELKPLEHICALLDQIRKAVPSVKASAKERIRLLRDGQPLCFLLYKGAGVLSRDEDSLVISTITSPNIFGINKLLPPEINVTFVATTDIEYIKMSQEEFYDFVKKNDAWEHVSYVQMYLASKLYEHQRLSAGLSTYKQICNLLYALINEDFETRAMTPASVYIQERTFLSRSGIMKILSDLKAGGYIVIKRGVLIKINKLPESY